MQKEKEDTKMKKTGAEVKVVIHKSPILYADGTVDRLWKGAIAGAFSDFVTTSVQPYEGEESVEVFCNHPSTGKPTTAIIPATCVTIADY